MTKEYKIRLKEEVTRVIMVEAESEQEAKLEANNMFLGSIIHITHVEENKC